jgi:hypothetical protein
LGNDWEDKQRDDQVKRERLLAFPGKNLGLGMTYRELMGAKLFGAFVSLVQTE